MLRITGGKLLGIFWPGCHHGSMGSPSIGRSIFCQLAICARPGKARGGSSQQVLSHAARRLSGAAPFMDIGSARYKVSSQSVADAFYDVSFGPDGWRCTARTICTETGGASTSGQYTARSCACRRRTRGWQSQSPDMQVLPFYGLHERGMRNNKNGRCLGTGAADANAGSHTTPVGGQAPSPGGDYRAAGVRGRTVYEQDL